MNTNAQNPEANEEKRSEQLQLSIAVLGLAAVMLTLLSILPVGTEIGKFFEIDPQIPNLVLWTTTALLYVALGIFVTYYNKHYKVETPGPDADGGHKQA